MQPDIRMIALNQLHQSKDNVRKQPHTQAEVEQMATSIESVGLEQNLIVVEGDGGFEVVGGGGRLAGLKQLARRGRIAPTSTWPCRVLGPQERAAEHSLVENWVRKPLGPFEEADAFEELAKLGMSTEHIADRIGTSVRRVRQRRAIAAITPEVRALYEKGKMRMDAVNAIAGLSPERQSEAIRLTTGGDPSQAYEITRRELLQVLGRNRIAQSMPVAQLAAERYEQRGGTYEEDLFTRTEDTEIWLTNPELCNTIAREMLEERAKAIRSEEGWGWYRITLEPPIACETELPLARIGREAPPSAQDERALAERESAYEDARRRLDALQQRGAGGEDVLDEQWEQAGERLAQAEEALIALRRHLSERKIYSKEECAAHGIVVGLRGWGRENEDELVVVSRGHSTGASAADDEPAQEESEATDIGVETDAGPRKLPSVLTQTLRTLRAGVVAEALGASPKDANALLTTLLVHWASHSGTGNENGNGTTSPVHDTSMTLRGRPVLSEQARALRPGGIADATLERVRALETTVAEARDRADDLATLFTRVRKASNVQQARWRAAALALMLVGRLHEESDATLLEAVIEQLDIDWSVTRDHATEVLGQIPRMDVLVIGDELIGKEWHRDSTSKTRTRMVQEIETALKQPQSGSAERRAVLEGWTPPGMTRAPTQESAPRTTLEQSNANGSANGSTACAEDVVAQPERTNGANTDEPIEQVEQVEQVQIGARPPEAPPELPAFLG